MILVNDKPVNSLPISKIFSPKSGDEFRSDESIQFSAQGSIDLDGDLLEFTWYSSLDGEILQTSNTVGTAIISQGTHVITLKVVDSKGAFSEQSVQIVVSLSEESFESEESPLNSVSLLISISSIATVSLLRRKN